MRTLTGASHGIRLVHGRLLRPYLAQTAPPAVISARRSGKPQSASRPFAVSSAGGVQDAWPKETIMPTNKKKKIRARMDKTGESYQTALRNLGLESAGPPEPPDIGALLAEFRVGHISSIQLRRLSGARSATREAAEAQATLLARKPTWEARSESRSKGVTRTQLDLFRQLGATERGQPQAIIVLHPDEARVEFSVQCANCHLWINCLKEERAEDCFCGQRFRVVFERTTDWSTAQLAAVRFQRCAGCGGELGMYPVGNPLGKQHALTASMTACDACVHAAKLNRWRGTARPVHPSILDDADLAGIPNTFYQYKIGTTQGTLRASTAFHAVMQVLSRTLGLTVEFDEVEWVLSSGSSAHGRLMDQEVTAQLAG
jgi:hypothetical protein